MTVLSYITVSIVSNFGSLNYEEASCWDDVAAVLGVVWLTRSVSRF